MAPLLFAVWTMATVTWKDNIVMIGGVDQNDKVLNNVMMNNVNTGKHTKLPNMGKRRRGALQWFQEIELS